MTEAVLGLLTPAQIEEVIGPTFNEFIDNPNCTTRALRDVSDPDSDVVALIYVNERTNEAFLLALSLPEKSGPFTLTGTRPDGGEPITQQFTRMSSLTGVQLQDPITTEVAAKITWEIIDANETVLLRSAAA